MLMFANIDNRRLPCPATWDSLHMETEDSNIPSRLDRQLIACIKLFFIQWSLPVSWPMVMDTALLFILMQFTPGPFACGATHVNGSLSCE